MRIVRVANFVAPRSGGLRTALRELGAGYVEAGHDVSLIVPGQRDEQLRTKQGRVFTVAGPLVPGTGGYRVLLGRGSVQRLLERLEPDRLEVSDRTTLRWTGRWARERGVPAVAVSHESLDGLLRLLAPPGLPCRAAADSLNRGTADSFDQVVCTTAWAEAEFRRIGAGNLTRAPLGVDLTSFRPDLADPRLRAALAGPAELLLVHCGRLSAEKLPERSVAAVAELHRRGIPVRLVVAGDGPRRHALQRQAAGLPVRFIGFVRDRGRLASLLATADVVLAPGPVETFGLAALEALASGTPVVASGESALGEVIGEAGVAVGEAGVAVGGPRFGPCVRTASYADGVAEIASWPADPRRAAARARAELFSWPAAVRAWLAVHGASAPAVAR